MLFPFSTLALAVLGAVCVSSSPLATTSLLYEYPLNKSSPGWIENLAVRPNGEIIFTSIGSPGQLHLFNPQTHNPVPTTIPGFQYRDTLGIVETERDVFYIINADFNTQTVTITNGTNSIWKLDFAKTSSTTLPKLEKIVDVPSAKFLNGLTAFNDTILLAADSGLGVVWAIDIARRKSWITADDPLMKPVSGRGYLEGINGLHIQPAAHHYSEEKMLCFTNSQQYVFACIPLDANAGAASPASISARPKPEKGFSAINWDDFAYDSRGNALVATERGNSIQAIRTNGQAVLVAGGLNSSCIASPTATAFGRGRNQQRTLYVTTAGSAAFPVIVNGKSVDVGAQIVAIDVSGIY